MITEKNSLISAVVLSYNRPFLLGRSLKSIFAQTQKPHEVIVIDNPSVSSSQIRDMVKKDFPAARLIQSESNLGYTGGMNLGIRQAQGEYILLHEDDLVLKGNYIEKLMSAFAGDKNTGAASGVILDEEGKVIFAGGRLTLGRSYSRIQCPQDQKQYIGRDQLRLQDWLPGASFMIRKDTFDTLGGFDEDFFAYEDDIDLSLRIRRRGYKLYYASSACAYHLAPDSQNNLPEEDRKKIMFHRYKNPLMLYIKHAKPFDLFAFILWHQIIFLKNIILQPDLMKLEAWLKGNLWIAKNSPRLFKKRYAKPDRKGIS